MIRITTFVVSTALLVAATFSEAAAPSCDITIKLGTTSKIGSATLNMLYVNAPGEFPGSSTSVACQALTNTLTVFVDTDITREAAAQVAARGKTTADAVFAAMAAQNRIGRMHQPFEVGAAIVQLLKTQPSGCVYELDRNPPAFVDEEQSP